MDWKQTQEKRQFENSVLHIAEGKIKGRQLDVFMYVYYIYKFKIQRLKDKVNSKCPLLAMKTCVCTKGRTIMRKSLGDLVSMVLPQGPHYLCLTGHRLEHLAAHDIYIMYLKSTFIQQMKMSCLHILIRFA